MAKEKTAFVCDSCGYDSAKWLGRCPSCGQWNTFKEIRLAAPSSGRVPLPVSSDASNSKAVNLSEVDMTQEPRLSLGDAELDRVLGGGLVRGSLVLLGGEPGIGKSTLIMQTVMGRQDLRILYVSGEESLRQLKLRADRICPDLDQSTCRVMSCTNLEEVFQEVASEHPDLVIIDSIQTISTQQQESAAGSLTQVRECTSQILKVAKQTQTSFILIGHITKEGSIAGPKILEHMVDTVLQFEGDGRHYYRMLRSIKNRFGSTDELGIYEMRQDGLRGVENPSELLLSENRGNLSGVAVGATLEGARPLLVEVQALVSTAVYGYPQHSATGFDLRRLNMLLAVLEKRVGFKLDKKDVFLNIAGGFRVSDTSMDLAVLTAVLSSSLDISVDKDVCLIGEVGLSGEIRSVSRPSQRISEAARLGFTRIIIPKHNLKGLDARYSGLRLIPVERVEEAFRHLFASSEAREC